MPFTDKEIQDKWKNYSYWMDFAKYYSDEMNDISRKYHRCSVLAEKFKMEHAEMVRANRKERK